MLDLAYTSQFKKDVKKKRKQGSDLSKLDAIITLLRQEIELPPSNRDHALSGNFRGHRECHIEPDWLLIYRVDHSSLILTAVRTGSHSELLGI